MNEKIEQLGFIILDLKQCSIKSKIKAQSALQKAQDILQLIKNELAEEDMLLNETIYVIADDRQLMDVYDSHSFTRSDENSFDYILRSSIGRLNLYLISRTES